MVGLGVGGVLEEFGGLDLVGGLDLEVQAGGLEGAEGALIQGV